MKTQRFVRKLDALGRVIEPKEYWEILGIHVGEPVEVMMDAQNGSIQIRKITVSCSCCGETDNLRILKENVYLCTECIKRMYEAIDTEIPPNYLRG